jgi:hypothetical protein
MNILGYDIKALSLVPSSTFMIFALNSYSVSTLTYQLKRAILSLFLSLNEKIRVSEHISKDLTRKW